MSWQRKAACDGQDPEMFYVTSSKSKKRDRAKAICDACPVQPECLENAIHNEQFGFWGGHTSEERTEIRLARGMPYYRVPMEDVTA